MGIDGSDIVITAANLAQVQDSLTGKDTKTGKLYPSAEKIEKLIKDKDEITITIESAGIEMEANSELEMPTGLDDKTLNLVFTSPFKKAEGVLTILDQANLDNFNITLPNGNFGGLHIDTRYCTVNVASAGTTDVEFSANIRNSNYKLTLGSGVNVSAKYGNISGNVVTNGATIASVIIDNWSLSANGDGKGISSGIYNKEVKSDNLLYAKNIVIRTAASISGFTDKIKTNPLSKITVEDGATLNLYTAATEIVGIRDSKGNITANVKVGYSGTENTDGGYFGSIKKATNVNLSGDFYPTIAATDLSNTTLEFYGYYFDDTINSIENVDFKAKENVGSTWFYVNVPAQEGASSYTFTFKNVEFPTGARFNTNSWDNILPELDADGNPVKITWYYWNTGEYDSKIYSSWWTRSKDIEVVEEYVEKNNFVVGAVVGSTSYRQLVESVSIEYNEDNGYWYLNYTYRPAKTQRSKDYYDIPASYRKNYPKADTAGNVWWWPVTDEPTYEVTYDNFTLVFAFNNCTYNGKKFTKDVDAWTKVSTPDGENLNVRYNIDGKLYRALKGNETEIYSLVEVNE